MCTLCLLYGTLNTVLAVHIVFVEWHAILFVIWHAIAFIVRRQPYQDEQDDGNVAIPTADLEAEVRLSAPARPAVSTKLAYRACPPAPNQSGVLVSANPGCHTWLWPLAPHDLPSSETSLLSNFGMIVRKFTSALG